MDKVKIQLGKRVQKKWMERMEHKVKSREAKSQEGTRKSQLDYNYLAYGWDILAFFLIE